MTPVPIDLPLRPSEAASLAEVIFAETRNRVLTEDIRNRLTGRAGTLGLVSIKAYLGSLQPDPVHSSAYYLAVDGLSGASPAPLLLHIAPASAPATALFPNPLLIGRMRPGGGSEIVINAVPFGATDIQNIEVFANQIAPPFLPRPFGVSPAVCVIPDSVELMAPAAFQAFKGVLKLSGQNLAAFQLPADAGEFWALVWAAVRSGFREGYSVTGPCTEATAGLFSRFIVRPDDLAATLQAARQAQPGRAFDLELQIPDGDPATLASLSSAVQGVQIDQSLPDWERLCEAAREHGALPGFRFDELPGDGLLAAARKVSNGRFVLTTRLREPSPDPVLAAIAAMRG